MEKISIRKISEIDINVLKKFYAKTFNFEQDILENYTWRYRTGYNNCEPIVLTINNQICGHAGLIPVDLKVNNIKENAIWFTDFYIDSKYRNRGYGKLLTEEWMNICPLQITLCNNSSLKIFKKLKWQHNNNFLRTVKILNYFHLLPFLRNFKKNKKNIKVDVDKLNINVVNNKDLSKIIETTEKISSNQNTGLLRDENWFRWRVLNCPYKKNITIFCYEGEFLIAHIFKKNKLKRMNIIFSTHKTSNKIFKLILLWSKKNHIDYLSYIENKINTSSNFLSPKKNINFAFFSKEESKINEIGNKFKDIQYIDSDIDFI
tara:strand:- start:1009 stop:1962 length:954 start_codon:yes stop_codon:yes gene_type:complete